MKTTAIIGLAALAGCASGPKARNVPELLKTEKGEEVSTVETWEKVRKPEILKWFTENEYGVRPEASKPKRSIDGGYENLKFDEIVPEKVMMNGMATRKRVRATFKGPYGEHSFTFTAFIPRVKKPAPAFLLICNRKPEENIDPERIIKNEFWPAEEIVARGYAAITFYNGDVAPDWNTGNTQGIFAKIDGDKAQPKNPWGRWGTLSAWAWGASRVMDWIETEPKLDAKHVAVVGHSRGGKTALVTAVYDSRFAMACSNDSGCSGAKLNHVELPESEHIARITSVFPYWFAQKYIMWSNKEEEMPYDQHEFIALIAPRLVCIASASEDKWAGQEGEFLGGIHASPAWELYGKKGLVADEFPKAEDPQQEGCISYHLRTGKHHLLGYDWKCYMDFADKHGWRQ